jgi:hypothetical protein
MLSSSTYSFNIGFNIGFNVQGFNILVLVLMSVLRWNEIMVATALLSRVNLHIEVPYFDSRARNLQYRFIWEAY